MEEFHFRSDEMDAVAKIENPDKHIIAQIDTNKEHDYHATLLNYDAFSKLLNDLGVLGVNAHGFHENFNSAFGNRDVSELDDNLFHFYELCSAMIRNSQAGYNFTDTTSGDDEEELEDFLENNEWTS